MLLFVDAVMQISYGPCQTPTLYFCVERMWEIMDFKREDFWEISAAAKRSDTLSDRQGQGAPRSWDLQWVENRTFDSDQADEVKAGSEG